MQRKVKFILLFVTSLIVISITSFALFLNTVAPMRANTPIEAVTIGFQTPTPVRFFPNTFESCTKDSNFTQCSVDVQKRPLEITLNYKQLERNQLPRCIASYAGQDYSCIVSSGGYAGGVRFLNSVVITSTLGLTSQQLQSLSKDNWFAQLNQTSWLQVSTILSGIFGILAAIIIWQYPNKCIQITASLVIGFNIFYLSVIQLYKIKPVSSILYSLNEPQIMLIAGLFAALGIGMILMLNWRRQNLIKIFALIGGVNVFHIFGLLVYSFLVSGGFVIADY
ncbi:hypothetical protein NIES4071_83500 [Calothrix sp. NIES-4071]|nr:hypothetical protein NIES4071_83500 [Calothrix sp. NIES-4071]BAZ62618.1 hypothetical protein NIES4105_83430 [Calothrix sp. NIES-4105]